MGMSEWILTKIFPPAKKKWDFLLQEIAHSSQPRFVLAEINDFLNGLSSIEFMEIVSEKMAVSLEAYWANYLAATIEYSAYQKNISPPLWLREIPPLEKPVFGTELLSLRLHLLTRAPVPFRNRNIFIDSTVGDRV